MKICEICGAKQSINDLEKRNLSHLEGKLHQGFQIVRTEYENLKKRAEMVELNIEVRKEEIKRNGKNADNEINEFYHKFEAKNKNSDQQNEAIRYEKDERLNYNRQDDRGLNMAYKRSSYEYSNEHEYTRRDDKNYKDKNDYKYHERNNFRTKESEYRSKAYDGKNERNYRNFECTDQKRVKREKGNLEPIEYEYEHKKMESNRKYEIPVNRYRKVNEMSYESRDNNYRKEHSHGRDYY
jgi:hypothetical protein